MKHSGPDEILFAFTEPEHTLSESDSTSVSSQDKTTNTILATFVTEEETYSSRTKWPSSQSAPSNASQENSESTEHVVCFANFPQSVINLTHLEIAEDDERSLDADRTEQMPVASMSGKEENAVVPVEEHSQSPTVENSEERFNSVDPKILNDVPRKRKRSSLSGIIPVQSQRARHTDENSRQSLTLEVIDDRERSSSILSELSQTPSIPEHGSSATTENFRDRQTIVPSSQEHENVDILNPESLSQSDEYFSDSSSSLGDLDQIYNSFRLPRPDTPQQTANGSRSTRSNNGRGVTSTSGPVYKHSLENLLKHSQLESAAQENIKKTKDALELLEQSRTSAQKVKPRTDGNSETVNETVLASVFNARKKNDNVNDADARGNEDEDDDERERVEKVVQAMHRADVLQAETGWNFFDNNTGNPASSLAAPEFPSSQWADSPLSHDQKFREQSFLTGFAIENLLLSASPTRGLLSWLVESAILEPRSDLAAAYIRALKACAFQVQDNVDADMLSSLLTKLGAKSESLDPWSSIEPVNGFSKGMNFVPFQLPRFLKFIRNMTENLGGYTRIMVISLLLRMGADTFISSQEELPVLLQDAVASHIDSIPESESEHTLLTIGEAIFEGIQNLELRQRIVNVVPEETPRLHLFKRRLALAFFLNKKAPLRNRLDDFEAIWEGIHTRLEKDPAFDVYKPNVDYRRISISISLLDVAFDAGFSPSLISRINRLNSGEQTSSKSERDAFDSSIDKLTLQVKLLSARIVDTGASHYSRGEAKAVLERLESRLEHGVRTVPKPRGNAFNGEFRQTKMDAHFRSENGQGK